MSKKTAKDESEWRKENWLSELTVEIAKKRRETNAKKDQSLRMTLNKKLQRAIRKDEKHLHL